MKWKLLLAGANLFLVVIITSCKKNDEVNMPVQVVTVTKPPYANAGTDQILVLPKDSVRLDGSGSVDPDGRIVSWLWTQISGPGQVAITNANTEVTMIANFLEGDYSFKLTVTDDNGAVRDDTVGVKFIKQLSGFEYSFQQTWGFNEGPAADNDVYVTTILSPDLFSNPNVPIQVSLLLNASVNWINVPKDTDTLGTNSKYYYYIGVGGDDWLYIYAYYPGSASELIGKGVTVKIRFL